MVFVLVVSTHPMNSGEIVKFLVNAQINGIHDALDAMKKTESGRAELREAGWVIEDEPEAIDPARVC
jgi:hypothetical protein